VEKPLLFTQPSFSTDNGHRPGETDMAAFGFAAFPRVVDREECQALIRFLSSPTILRSRAGARHLLSVAEVAAVAQDPRLIAIARDALKSEPFPFRATLFEKSQEANWLVVWHQDTSLPVAHPFEADGWGPWWLKAGVHYVEAPAWALNRVVALRLHLDDATTENGPLRVLPGSHKSGLLTDQTIQRLARQTAAVECTGPQGTVLAMHPLIVHSSSKSRSSAPRRVLHIEYADSAVEVSLAVA
jgi:ectoine hydroxylase-related dioxygenase (phytanoyl-CoA dioxygenase family)